MWSSEDERAGSENREEEHGQAPRGRGGDRIGVDPAGVGASAFVDVVAVIVLFTRLSRS